jgi:hypothetical protein
VIEAPTLGTADARVPRSFLIRFDDDTLARLNAWAQESGCAATHLITQIVKDVLRDDALMNGEAVEASRLTTEAQLVFSAKLWKRGFDTARIARFLNIKEAAVANAIEAIKTEAKA